MTHPQTPPRDLRTFNLAPAKPTQEAAKRPQPGDRVPWAEVEDGCLYWADDCHSFRMVTANNCGLMSGPEDGDIAPCADGTYGGTARHRLQDFHGDMQAVLVARDLGTDPEAWRKAMREWTANGNRPAPKPDLANMTAAQAAEWLNREHGSEATYAVFSISEYHAPALAATDPNDPLTPLRAPGVLSPGGCNLATPERLAAVARDIIEGCRREIERLRAANAEARRALETPGRQGLRARLAKAEADLEATQRELRDLKATRAVVCQAGRLEVEAMVRERARLMTEMHARDNATIKAAHARTFTEAIRQRDEARADLETARQVGALAVREWREWARPFWPEGPRNPTDEALRAAVGARITKGLTLPDVGSLARLRGAMPEALHDLEGRTTSDMVWSAAERISSLERNLAEALDRLDDLKHEAGAMLAPLAAAMGWSRRTDLSSAQIIESAAGALGARFAEIERLRVQNYDRASEVTKATERAVEAERLLDGRYHFPATLLEPLRALAPAAITPAEVIEAVRRVVEGAGETQTGDLRCLLANTAGEVERWKAEAGKERARADEQPAEETCLDAQRYRNACASLGLASGGRIVVHVGNLELALSAAKERAEVAETRAEKAERNLRAAAELLAA